MSALEKKEAEHWETVLKSLESMTKRLDGIDVVQCQLLQQADLVASEAEHAAQEHDLMARQIVKMDRSVAQLRLEKMAEGLDRASDGESHRPGSR
ncbi:hypothetical protein PR202_ga24883 [Eleusine coracana subsp. coracana]|uniref:Uncharacterized protein n=1 Tax=Eleusine coracana subsp. coracana TaxID=191504 RepID=A0AAV5DAR1_ELECO|nr:hypothetical protein PR202_ga24883 [Eleusine coracana subsp. coracana]